MNVYVVYSFNDYENVKKHIDEVREKVPNVSCFYFEPNRKIKLWHKRAADKIKQSNLVLFFDPFDRSSKEGFKNINWELKCAEKYKKRIVVFKNSVENIDDYASQIYSTDYSDLIPNRSRYRTKPLSQLVSFLETEANWSVENSFTQRLPKDPTTVSAEDRHFLLEQYRIMIDTSEKLMERRQAVGNLYTTICAALIAFIGTSFSFNNFMITGITCLCAGLIIIMLSCNWRASLRAYELNNTGKYEVINQLEHYLPADIFDCEYKYNTQNGIKSYSARERMLPIVFLVLGILLIVLAAILIVLHFVVPVSAA